ncbi:MAG: SatD family protein [Cyclobacteriaceae bacterium]|nr:SatD family protein [Cyclobacteriaceae bacterium]
MVGLKLIPWRKQENKMVAILTGDIINSRKGEVIDWIDRLKNVLNHYGSTPQKWEIFRGDSFQLMTEPNEALLAAIHIKAVIKQTKFQDVRIAIGIGKETYTANRISESNGDAYMKSGEMFERLKKQTLAIKTESPILDEPINLMLSLALLTANNWSSTVAEIIRTYLENPNNHQKDIAQILNKSQSSISEALKRGGYEEIINLNNYYKDQIKSL